MIRSPLSSSSQLNNRISNYKPSSESHCWRLRSWSSIVFLGWCMLNNLPLRALAMSMSSSLRSSSSSSQTIVVIGGGIQGASVAYYLAQLQKQQQQQSTSSSSSTTNNNNKKNIIVLESQKLASAASGKGGGFMARSWGDGSSTQRLHEVAFDLYDQELSTQLPLTSYRTLPVLSVTPGTKQVEQILQQNPKAKSLSKDVVPKWLNGKVGGISLLGAGQDTAQVTPAEVVDKMLQQVADQVQVILGTCTGITTSTTTEQEDHNNKASEQRRVTGITYIQQQGEGEEVTLAADVVCVCAGPWSCAAEDWFDGAVQLPMEGIKSTSIVWKPPPSADDSVVDGTALFCGEDHRYNTHLEVYPRPDGSIYICGIGGSDYITKEQLQQGAFREECAANDARVNAAVGAFHTLSEQYHTNGELDRVQACMRPCPPDAMPYMGRIPGYQGAFINAGHNCWGIAWAPACGKAMAQLILQGECQLLDLSPFDPARFTPAAARGSRGRKQRGTNVGEQW